jgi:hypothetical protein
MGRPERFWLGKLARYRDKSVRELIEASVFAYANSFSVNNTNDMAAFCRKTGVQPDDVNEDFATLNVMIARRHHIVHQADRNEQVKARPAPTHCTHSACKSLNTHRVVEVVEAAGIEPASVDPPQSGLHA